MHTQAASLMLALVFAPCALMAPVGPKLTKKSLQEVCGDDPKWTDRDGDGCAVYAKAIAQRKLTQAEACEYSNGLAKLHCRATCGMCGTRAAGTDAPQGRRPDHAHHGPHTHQQQWVQQLIQRGLHGQSVNGKKQQQHQPAATMKSVRQESEELFLPSHNMDDTAFNSATNFLDAAFPSVRAQQPTKVKETCMDDHMWQDAQGDNCASYAKHIKDKILTKAEACGWATGALNNQDGQASVHCPMTCGTCAMHKDLLGGAAQGDLPGTQAAGMQQDKPKAPNAGMETKELAQKATTVENGAPKEQTGTMSFAEYRVTLRAPKSPIMKRQDPSKVHTPPPPANSQPALVLENKEACLDDPNWVDTEGDGCANYVKAISTKVLTLAEACGTAPEALNNQNGQARIHCRATCGTCTPASVAPVQHVKLGPLPHRLPEGQGILV